MPVKVLRGDNSSRHQDYKTAQLFNAFHSDSSKLQMLRQLEPMRCCEVIRTGTQSVPCALAYQAGPRWLLTFFAVVEKQLHQYFRQKPR